MQSNTLYTYHRLNCCRLYTFSHIKAQNLSGGWDRGLNKLESTGKLHKEALLQMMMLWWLLRRKRF